MNRSPMIRTGAVAAAVALAGAVAIATTAGAATSSDQPPLTLVETVSAFHSIDAPAPDADGKAGDTITFESTLRTKAGVKKGTLEGHCLQIRADGSLDDREVTVTLGAESYRMAGPFDPTTGGTLTITGGTDQIVNQLDGTAIHTVTLTRR
ncbi:MAG: hypothetical protein JWQ81_508 [Amycolatopsis sp.]|jgi:hypothetical protein|uniref:hypothetical protein n=1 Tax=Amycolatopsis sp. TaxID=37632 RepID=UPI002607B698|nr:hypothetical protein [Amycolatopsis sp.]MCU1679769.1 hypothetical protein [Amycolatopsis sp.]